MYNYTANLTNKSASTFKCMLFFVLYIACVTAVFSQSNTKKLTITANTTVSGLQHIFVSTVNKHSTKKVPVIFITKNTSIFGASQLHNAKLVYTKNKVTYPKKTHKAKVRATKAKQTIANTHVRFTSQGNNPFSIGLVGFYNNGSALVSVSYKKNNTHKKKHSTIPAFYQKATAALLGTMQKATFYKIHVLAKAQSTIATQHARPPPSLVEAVLS